MGLILQGILTMPYPDDPADLDPVTWTQTRSAMREADAEIERLLGALGEVLKADDLDQAKSHALDALPDNAVREMGQIYSDLLANQEPLGPEFEKVIEDNLESLYET
jgi:hypothetical protein